jgi:HEAT repeat protein
MIDPDWASRPEALGPVAVLVQGIRQNGEAGQDAAEGVLLIGSPAVRALVTALAAEDRVLREAAARVLGRIGPGAGAAVPALVHALQDPNTWVRDAAAEALQNIDPQAPRSPDRRDPG